MDAMRKLIPFALRRSISRCCMFATTIPKWEQKIIKEALKKIERNRNEKASLGAGVALSDLDPKQFKLVCPVCHKPNILPTKYCGSCAFALQPIDVQQVPENPFLSIIANPLDEHVVLFRDKDVIVFEDKFSISDYHLDSIPVEVIRDLTLLRREHIPLIEKMYSTGVTSLKKLNHPALKVEDFEKIIIAGFNYPVSVYHLHLHLILPPLYHTNAFKHPRWHSYQKVLNDLKDHGKVITYHERPNPMEGNDFYTNRIVLNNDHITAKYFGGTSNSI
eukprot:TRINITY_DN7883_c0_g1_i1.p1 TRINITY_DN7883_c0_g1~~TRINITY_DN7883_c0_g1_i1.p1  ORF type:complete len:276 (-),score=51.20 TRINITY_DN7883_c0_g1_i1:23-850(-)